MDLHRYHYSLKAEANTINYDEVDLHFARLVDNLPLEAIYTAFCCETMILAYALGK